ncbi:TetR/AcrR family transcriptional regulator [Breoghania sp. L-A4]|uniref:TetR/AcrR family transcriptional regulator n=1 Tax=Breoghania sp. L-A4 TaxID=2304600 RepID=UPI000E359691|nr:TetR/AcrR family transcriptional regulator [Breoghania sp. L-A4]AXS41797.1 TetR/AcrR family transcriptional regulator [Breoghania sp. L-A4]
MSTGTSSRQHHKPQCGPGRPRAFDEATALKAALELFWRQGYEASSIAALTEAMGISRSSFYGCFGSKHDVLMAALQSYSDAAYAALSQMADGPAAEAVPRMITALADPTGGERGCMFANTVSEVAPHAPDVADLSRRHLARIEALFARALSPDDPDGAADRAGAIVALGLGIIVLRKAGVPSARLEAMLDQGRALIGTQAS